MRGKHGLTESPEFKTWTDIKTRCHNPKSTGYRNYGGRGIEVCSRWRGSFLAFLEDMGSKPLGYSIERIDNDKNYEPGNCRWSSPKEQANNRRTNRLVAINGVTRNFTQWAEAAGISTFAIWQRYNRGDRGTHLIRPIGKGGRKAVAA